MTERIAPTRPGGWALSTGVVLFGVVLTACVTPVAVESLELGSCGVEGPGHPERCAELQVPLDWDDPDGPQIQIQVLVVPARADDPAPDPLFYLAGFGSSALADAQWAHRTFSTLEGDRDLVFVEQRGTGATAEHCQLPGENVVDPDAIRAAVDRCLEALERDPRHDTTPTAVRDLDLARAALGYERINLYGGSYGVSMGLAYLQQHPDRVRTALFDSGSLLDTRLWELVPTNAQYVLDETVRACRAAPTCAAFDPAEDLSTIVTQLLDSPVSVDVAGGQTVTVDLVGFLDGLIDQYLATPEGRETLPADLHALARGEWARVFEDRGLVNSSDAPGSQAQTVTIRCSDEWARVDPEAVAAQSGSVFAPAMAARAEWQEAVCSVWPHDPGVSGAVRAGAPVVFLNGALDPADPPSNVAAATGTMPGALVVAVPGAGHGTLGDPCILTEAIQFIRAGRRSSAGDWTECLAALAAKPQTFSAG